MLENLSSRFKDIFKFIGKKGAIDEKDLDVVLREIRLVLLEADVALPLVKFLTTKLKEDLLGKEIYKSVSPKQVILKSLYDNIFEILSSSEEDMALYTKPTTFCMIVGLQGTGKTTSAAKIAYFLKNKENKKVLLTSLDLARPAAYEQLQTLCQDNGLDFFQHEQKNLSKILTDVESYAKKNIYDVVILDTAGRLSIDEPLMVELQNVYKQIKPKEVLLVIDAMVGQIALQVASQFQSKVPLSGIIATKADADSRGGAILSCKYVTNVPIKFMGVGEKINNLQTFVPKRIVDNILDQGDIISLIENFENIDVSEEETLKLQKRLEKGLFSLEDYKKQLLQMKKLGGAGSLMSMIPGLGALKSKIQNSNLDETIFKKQIAIINSMTFLERKNAKVLNFSRKKRIAAGSATTLQDINILLKQYEMMAKTMKKMKGGGMKNMLGVAKELGLGNLMNNSSLKNLTMKNPK